MTPSRQVRRAQERAEAKVAARQANVAPPHNPCHMAARVGFSHMMNLIVRDIGNNLKLSVEPEMGIVHSDVAMARQAWLKYVHRQGQVPVEEVYSEENEGAYLIAPSRPGNKPGTIRVRIFGKNDAAVWTMPTDCGKFELPMAPQGEVRPGSAEDVWFKLSAHKRMAMFAAVAGRQIPPKYQTQEADHG